MGVPIVDLSGSPRGVAAELDAACREVGFLSVMGHGVERHVIDEAWGAAVAFFDLSVDEKLRAVDPEGPYGYSPFGAEALAASRGEAGSVDLKESFNLGPFHLGIGAIWPDLDGFRESWVAYYDSMDHLARRLLALFAVALGAPAAAFLQHFDRHTSALRALNYPALDAPVAPGQVRAGAHSDYGSLTILLPGPGRGGLEVLTRDDEWLRVPLVEGAFVVNIGDLMERWTNDRWVSTVHRVVNPPADVAGSERRQSIAYFQNPSTDARIEPLPECVPIGQEPRYGPVIFGEWLAAKVAAAHGD